jgi:hypothetical protein
MSRTGKIFRSKCLALIACLLHEEFATGSDRATIDSWLSARTKWRLWEWTSNAATK